MTRLTPDPTFYPTATEATAAPPERVGYVATIDATDRIDAWLRGLLRLRNGPPPGPASLRSGASGSRLSWLSD